ncbi:MAG: 4-(cytidine 5'-diphospho)-2-C-methyl-D-erythritol kinase [Rubrivivax sp.]
MALISLHDVPAPAKLNLFLHIVGRRADGMHLLQSPFILIDWADTLHFERRQDRRIHRHDLSQPLPDDDLCLRAARALQVASGCRLGVDISIDKRVPSGAGMGGGSSDAATVLLALNQLWGLHWPRSKLAPIGLQLGADVPFFIGGRNAFVEGIGERLTPLACPSMQFAVLKPAESLPTADIFGHPALVRDTEPVIVEGSSELTGHQMPENWMAMDSTPLHARDTLGSGRGQVFRNDLQPPAEDRCPQIVDAVGWLQARFGNSRMTGSGSAVFARVDGLTDGMAGPSALNPRFMATCSAESLPSGWTARICRSLPGHPLLGWAD